MPQLTAADLPMYADVWTLTTSTTPERFTATSPAIPALTPTPAMSSLLEAVTATPWNVSVPTLTVRGPVWLASPAGALPSGTMLCDLPLPLLVSAIGVTGPATPSQSSARPVA